MLNKPNFPSIEQMGGRLTNNNKSFKVNELPVNQNQISFNDILRKRQSTIERQVPSLRFSKHANERLLSRNIDLTREQMERLNAGARMAGEKGIKESLVMVDNLAFIVSVKNNMVITAVNDNDDKVFTNIDGAVIS